MDSFRSPHKSALSTPGNLHRHEPAPVVAMSRLRGVLALALSTALACAPGDDSLNQALEAITEEDLVRHIQVLSSDEFEGRGPSSAGEDRTVQYLKTEFEELGLEPGNGDSYFQ